MFVFFIQVSKRRVCSVVYCLIRLFNIWTKGYSLTIIK